MKASLKILLVGLAVVMGLCAGPGWSQEKYPAKALDPAKDLGIQVDRVLEGSEEIQPGEDTGGPTPRGIYGIVIVANYTQYYLYISRGSKCADTPIGVAPPFTGHWAPLPYAVGDFSGDTNLCAQGVAPGKGKTLVRTWKQKVRGRHASYRWNIRE